MLWARLERFLNVKLILSLKFTVGAHFVVIVSTFVHHRVTLLPLLPLLSLLGLLYSNIFAFFHIGFLNALIQALNVNSHLSRLHRIYSSLG